MAFLKNTLNPTDKTLSKNRHRGNLKSERHVRPQKVETNGLEYPVRPIG